MEHKIKINWKKNMAFETEINGHKLIMDVPAEIGGEDKGPRPKPLMLAALGGCTAIDMVWILKKMRIIIDDLKIQVISNLTDEDPKHYTSMHIIYEFFGKDLSFDKLEKAVKLSQEKYCGVSFMYRKAMEITYEIIIRS